VNSLKCQESFFNKRKICCPTGNGGIGEKTWGPQRNNKTYRTADKKRPGPIRGPIPTSTKFEFYKKKKRRPMSTWWVSLLEAHEKSCINKLPSVFRSTPKLSQVALSQVQCPLCRGGTPLFRGLRSWTAFCAECANARTGKGAHEAEKLFVTKHCRCPGFT